MGLIIGKEFQVWNLYELVEFDNETFREKKTS